MKKTFFYFLSGCIILAGIAFTSCKSHEKCPAYTKNAKDQNVDIKHA